MGFLSGLGARLGTGGGALSGKLPPGNGQWAQLANFFPDNGTGTPTDKSGQHVDVASILSALQSLASPPQQQAPPPPPDWMPMPAPRYMAGLQNAPRFAPPQMMAAPAQMAPYLWGR